MINPTNSQKLDPIVIHREMEAFKAYKYDELSQNPSLLFNYFLINNDIFQKIQTNDMQILSTQLSDYNRHKEYVQYSTFLSILAIDQGVMRVVAPTLRIPYMRPLVFVAKYLLGTMAITNAVMYKQYQALENTYFIQAQKYDFNYNDFADTVKILEKVAQEGQLEQLSRGDTSAIKQHIN